jgi:uracil-DNA glycosylase
VARKPTDPLAALIAEARACRVCEAHLPLGPRPILSAEASARLMIIGQAPGTRVHESGVPWDDASGDRLRDWLAIERDVFYDAAQVAIVPMGFCYPGRDKNGGDAPPRPECAPLWHARLRAELPNIALTLLVGRYAQVHYLGRAAGKSVVETVRAWRDHMPAYLPLPHPSWRTRSWAKKNPWFEAEVIPALRAELRRLLG